MRPIQLRIDESVQPLCGTHTPREARGYLNFLQLAIVQESQTGRISFHKLRQRMSRRDGSLGKWFCSRPEVDCVSVSAVLKQRRELGAEVWMADPHNFY